MATASASEVGRSSRADAGRKWTPRGPGVPGAPADRLRGTVVRTSQQWRRCARVAVRVGTRRCACCTVDACEHRRTKGIKALLGYTATVGGGGPAAGLLFGRQQAAT